MPSPSDLEQVYGRRRPEAKLLAKAMRHVERMRDLADGDGEWHGPPEPEWYETYASDVLDVYDELSRETESGPEHREGE